jgi:hypothetical protein
MIKRRSGRRPIDEPLLTISDQWLPRILGWIKSDPSSRYDSAMSAEVLFQVEPMK